MPLGIGHVLNDGHDVTTCVDCVSRRAMADEERMLKLLSAAQAVVGDAESNDTLTVKVDREVFDDLCTAVQAISDAAVATIERVLAEERRKGANRVLDEALNSGDGSYRP